MMQSVPDPYRVLGLKRGSTTREIKAAHRRLAKRYHPDGPAGDTSRFLSVQAAYQLLVDPVRRRAWDAEHAPGPVPADAGAPPGRRPRRPAADPGAASSPRPAGRGAGRPPEEVGRDPAASGYTWSAAGVPWWEDRPVRGRRRTASDGTAGIAPDDAGRGPGRKAGDRAAAKDTGTGASRQGGARSSAGGARRRNAPAAGMRPDQAPRASGVADEGKVAGAAGAAGEPGDGAAQGQGTDAPPPAAGMDVYARSSGAAWSAASRAYFRRAAADLPRGTRMGHSAWTGRVGWEPPLEEVLEGRHGPRGNGSGSAPGPQRSPEQPAGDQDDPRPASGGTGRLGSVIDRILGRREHGN